MPERIHFSNAQLKRVRSCRQPVIGDTTMQRGFGKPVGLWYSIDDAWPDWCRREGWNDRPTKYAHILTLDTSRILRIATAKELRAFGKRYAVQMIPGLSISYEIDWRCVAEPWAGIEIWPYQWECRLDQDCFWYYGWDVASGCVWDGSIVQRIDTQPRR